MISQREVEQKYTKLQQDVATMDFYKVDLTNRVNCYTCGSGHVTKFIDRDAGVTPMFLSCPTCGEQASSSGYRDISPELQPTHEWFRPTLQECQKMRGKKEAILEHVLNGGLEFRKI